MVKHFRRKEMKNIISMVAKDRGLPISQVRQEYEEIILSHKNSSDQEAREHFKKLFGNRTPSPEEYISKISKSL